MVDRGIQLSLETIVGGVSEPDIRYPAGKFMVTNLSNNNETRQLNASEMVDLTIALFARIRSNGNVFDILNIGGM